MVKKSSIGDAMRKRMESQADNAAVKGVIAGEVHDAVAEVPSVTDTLLEPQVHSGQEMLESFNTRLPRRIVRQLKVFSVQHEKKIQTVVLEALEEYLKKESK